MQSGTEQIYRLAAWLGGVELIFYFIVNAVYKEEWERSDSRYPSEQKIKKKPTYA